MGPDLRVSRVSAESVKRPWRRFLRLSVRGLIALVLVIGGWLGWIVRNARLQREAVAVIRNAGGSFSYDWEYSDGNYIRGATRRAPRLLVDLLGVDCFGHVTRVEFFRDGDLPSVEIGRLTRLQLLTVGSSTLSDAQMSNLKGLKELREVSFINSGVTDVGLAAVMGSANLEKLRVRSSRVTDAGVANLVRLSKLSILDLSNTQVTDAGLLLLNGMTKLKWLCLSRTRVTDAGLAHLNGLMNLSYLDLTGTQITDNGLVQLKGLTSLDWLKLSDTKVSDRGLTHLKSLTNLRLLELVRTQVTDRGATELGEALPGLTIDLH